MVLVSTYKALSSIVHQAQLKTLLILKGFSQGVTQAVRGQYTLPTLLKLAEYTLKKKTININKKKSDNIQKAQTDSS